MFGADRRGAPVYGVAVDASVGTATGISAMDRALTLRLLGSALSGPADFTRPGHVMPLLVEPDGERHGDGEHAALVAARLVGLGPAGGAAVLATLVSPREPIRSASCEEAQTFADDHGLVCVEMNAPDGRDLDRRSTSSASVFG
jgi:3,4-dihydroxy 2-butanone 4-phosphate synthase/GTP cyclohydrolase II